MNEKQLKEKIYKMLDKPMTISEIMCLCGYNPKSAHFYRFKTILLELMLEKPEVKMRKSGHVLIVWREK